MLYCKPCFLTEYGILINLAKTSSKTFNMSELSANLMTSCVSAENATKLKEEKPLAQKSLVKLVKVDKDGRTISTELVPRSEADAFVKAQNTKTSQIQHLSSTSQASSTKPIDIQAINRDITQKNALEKQLANQRVNIKLTSLDYLFEKSADFLCRYLCCLSFLLTLQKLLSTVNLSCLPDDGLSIKRSIDNLTSQINQLDLRIKNNRTRLTGQSQGKNLSVLFTITVAVRGHTKKAL